MFTLELCKTKDAYKAVLPQHKCLDLAVIAKDETVLLEGGIVLVVTIDGVEVTCHEYGELMIKTGDEALARRIAHHLEAYVHERRSPA